MKLTYEVGILLIKRRNAQRALRPRTSRRSRYIIQRLETCGGDGGVAAGWYRGLGGVCGVGGWRSRSYGV